MGGRRPHFVFDGIAAAWGLASMAWPRSDRNAHSARRHRECLDKYLPRVKIFEYANDGGHK